MELIDYGTEHHEIENNLIGSSGGLAWLSAKCVGGTDTQTSAEWREAVEGTVVVTWPGAGGLRDGSGAWGGCLQPPCRGTCPPPRTC